jgi:diguanylate cyclase (GGDEF)-like protein
MSGLILAALAVASGDGPLEWVWRPGVVVLTVASVTLGRRRMRTPWPIVAVLVMIAVRVAIARTTPGSTAFIATSPSWFLGLADISMGLVLSLALVWLLRGHRLGLGPRELLDGLAVAVGAGLVAWVVLVNPAIDAGTSPVLAIVGAAYVPLAIMILTLVGDMTFNTPKANTALLVTFAAAVANLGGDTLRALYDAGVADASVGRWIVGAFIVTLATMCSAIVHPQVAVIGHGFDQTNETIGTARRQTVEMAPLIVSLAGPAVLIASVSPTSNVDRVVRALAAVVLITAVVARLYVALEANAAAQRRLSNRLSRDELTNLMTRTRFVRTVADVLEETWRTERHPSVIQINVDRFKNINDTLGHEAANRLLVAIGERLSAVAEGFDGTVARVAGDDFMVLDRTTTSPVDALARADAIKAAFGPPFTFGESVVFVTVSMGVAVAPRNRTVTAEEMMRRVDIATHRAKADGRNRCVTFDESMQSNLAQRMDVEHALHGAIGRQEMQLYYQPIVDIVTGNLSGFEALMRWRRTDGTIVPPNEFIGIAEETGIINELGAWALKESLRELRAWIDDGTVPATATMSVNVSPRQIADPAFADVVQVAIDSSGLSPHLLWLEMTESMMLEEPELAQSTLRQIRTTGVRLALDDFGTGYSSLSLLQQFPIQRIKIDRAFVQGIADHSNDRSLVRTIIAMAQSMGLDLVAEGVETVHQLQSLRDLGCDKAQGYLISRPVPPQAMRTTMVALVELAELALFAASEPSRPGVDTSDRWLETGSGANQPLGRHLVARPMH